jgi:hypothetical protein
MAKSRIRRRIWSRLTVVSATSLHGAEPPAAALNQSGGTDRFAAKHRIVGDEVIERRGIGRCGQARVAGEHLAGGAKHQEEDLVVTIGPQHLLSRARQVHRVIPIDEANAPADRQADVDQRKVVRFDGGLERIAIGIDGAQSKQQRDRRQQPIEQRRP